MKLDDGRDIKTSGRSLLILSCLTGDTRYTAKLRTNAANGAQQAVIDAMQTCK
jgi:hypothetical protein